MTCDDILDLVEPLAADELTPTEEVRAHLETYHSCAAALATARRIEATLAARLVVEAPARFSASVHQRIRRERWVAEQRVDLAGPHVEADAIEGAHAAEVLRHVGHADGIGEGCRGHRDTSGWGHDRPALLPQEEKGRRRLTCSS